MSGPGNPAVAASRHALNLSWLLRLRAWGVAGQLLVVLVVELALGISLPRGPLAALLLVSVASIGAAALYLRRGRPVGEGTVAATLAFDVVLFTALLYFTGGPMNPFSFLYLVHLALATLVVSQRYTWMLVALALAGSAALFVSHVPIAMHGPAPAGSGDPADHADHSAHAGHVDHSAHAGHVDHSAHAAHAGHAGHGGADGEFDLHLQGMWVALGVAASFIVYFLARVTAALRARDAELDAARDRAARSEKVAAIATLAAGAAHELGSPLATIAIAAKELERLGVQPEVVDDARLIRQEVDRCRDILGQLSAGAGEMQGEGTARVTLAGLVEGVLAGLPGRERVDVRWGEAPIARVVEVPPGATARAIRNVVKNALDASPPGARVEVTPRCSEQVCTLEIVDHGTGMAPEVLARASEPFFTTKAPGAGMGLGLFLTRSVVEQLGGSVQIQSTPGGGTRVEVKLPARVIVPATSGERTT